MVANFLFIQCIVFSKCFFRQMMHERSSMRKKKKSMI